ncbi:MAG: DUF1080 domain-containing protein [Gloeobacteraceae cyanobacterium ES-bin-144]|nr:DUF1080 domain-containing protein [Verrucomicrobiales bacterium]
MCLVPTLRLLTISAVTVFHPVVSHAAPEWKSLFNGKDLTGWSVTIDKLPQDQDPAKLVQVRDGAIHMYPDANPDLAAPFGVITSEGTYSRFHLALEYRWLEKKFAPRKDKLRDAGLLYYASNTGKIWPSSVEYQIQEGDSGDIIFISESGVSWLHPEPDLAPPGQGEAGLLPENGGILQVAKNQTYFGRFPEHDNLTGWNRAEVIVHADESAEHILNGHVRSRLANIRHLQGGVLKEGKICLQLEGAEIQYRKIEIRELDEPLRVDKTLLSLSAVKDQPIRNGTITVKNPLDRPVSANLSIIGKDKDAFSAYAPVMSLGAGESTQVTVSFRPPSKASRCSAGLRIGTQEEGAFVVLQGIGLTAFEGENEPPLQTIVNALGIPLNVGGVELKLDTKAATIGDGLAVSYFQKAGNGKVHITPLARFSPPGEISLGIVAKGKTTLIEIGKLADSGVVADAHQCLFPPADIADYEPAAESFAFYLKAHHYTSFTDPALPTEANIPHTARIFPVSHFGGRVCDHAFLVCFEEASNGDYQDAVFLIENIKPAP